MSKSINVVMIIPTGIGCEIGGHAGDATPAARLLGSVCDKLILHPNIVNASDINEMPENALYVEGSILDRFLEGRIELKEVNIDLRSGLCRKAYREGKLGDYKVNRSNIQVDQIESKFEQLGLNRDDGDAIVVIAKNIEVPEILFGGANSASIDS